MPATPPTKGTKDTGSAGLAAHQALSAWMATKEPRPLYTAWPKLSMPPCPSSMLYDRQAMMAMPIWESMVIDKPLSKIRGMTSITKAKASHSRTGPQRAAV